MQYRKRHVPSPVATSGHVTLVAVCFLTLCVAVRLVVSVEAAVQWGIIGVVNTELFSLVFLSLLLSLPVSCELIENTGRHRFRRP